MRRPPFRVALVPLVILVLIASITLGFVRPRIPLLGIGASCAFEPADGGSRPVDTLRRVATLPDGTSWMVGSRYSGSVGQPVALRRQGDRWISTEIPIGATNVTSGLHDVAALASGSAWAVGSSRARIPVAVEWDGAGWTETPTEGLPEDSTAEWLGVAASRAGGVLAVGKILEGLSYRTIVGRLEDGRMVASYGPNVGEGNNVFIDVDMRGAGNAWAVGWTVEDGVYRTLAARYAAGAWVIEPTPDPGAGDDVLTSVAVVDPDTAWAVGWSRDADGEPTPLTLRWDGEVWNEVRPPAVTGRFLAVAAQGSRLIVAGDSIGQDRRPMALAYGRVDGAWEQIAIDAPEDRWYTGVALWGEADVVAVGPQVIDERYGSFVATGC